MEEMGSKGSRHCVMGLVLCQDDAHGHTLQHLAVHKSFAGSAKQLAACNQTRGLSAIGGLERSFVASACLLLRHRKS